MQVKVEMIQQMIAIDSAVAESELTNVKNVERILKKLIDTDVQNSQDVHLEYKGPLKCVNKCGDPPSAGKIDQAKILMLLPKI